jgi:hypothetical protein
VYSIDEARYSIRVIDSYARGEVLLSGRVISGKPEAIPLFGDEVVVTNIARTTGGTVMLLPDREGVFFLPEAGAPEFQVLAEFSMRPEEGSKATSISFDIPKSLRNILDFQLPEGTQLVGNPGVVGTDGNYYFSATPRLAVSYAEQKDLITETLVEVELVSRIAVQQNRIFIETHFLPKRPVPGPLILHAPEEAQFVASSLRSSWIEGLDASRYRLNFPAGHDEPFSIEFSVPLAGESNDISFFVPSVEGNTGQQDRFVIDEPDDAQVTVTAEGILTQGPVARLATVLRESVAPHPSFRSLSTRGPLTLSIERFQSAGTPVTVLEEQYLFTSFEESGNILSVLVMDAPSELGPRLRLNAVPDAEIWSLTVNGKKRDVYAGARDSWIIPLDAGETSRVLLAFIRKGSSLGLQGRLDVIIPETGLPCRALRVGVALPERVDLLSLDGPVSPAVGEDWSIPSEFIGKRHFFSRTFYNGEGISLAAFYKEPVENQSVRKGARQ